MPFQVSLEIGDEVFIFEESARWYRGYVVSSLIGKQKEPRLGIFPQNNIHIRAYLGEVEPNPSSAGPQ